jgi:hypothetical protein
MTDNHRPQFGQPWPPDYAPDEHSADDDGRPLAFLGLKNLLLIELLALALVLGIWGILA